MKVFAYAAIFAASFALPVQAGGYVAPTISRVPIISPTDIAAPTGNSGWWVVGGAVVICLLICFNDDDEKDPSDPPDVVFPPIDPPIPIDPPAPVPLGPASGFLAAALMALAAMRRR